MKKIELLLPGKLLYYAKLITLFKQYTSFEVYYIKELLSTLQHERKVVFEINISEENGNAFLQELSVLGLGIGYFSWHEENRINT